MHELMDWGFRLMYRREATLWLKAHGLGFPPYQGGSSGLCFESIAEKPGSN